MPLARLSARPRPQDPQLIATARVATQMPYARLGRARVRSTVNLIGLCSAGPQPPGSAPNHSGRELAQYVRLHRTCD